MVLLDDESVVLTGPIVIWQTTKLFHSLVLKARPGSHRNRYSFCFAGWILDRDLIGE